jgi:hypothetical protein
MAAFFAPPITSERGVYAPVIGASKPRSADWTVIAPEPGGCPVATIICGSRRSSERR